MLVCVADARQQGTLLDCFIRLPLSMDFNVKLINRRGWWLLLYIVGLGLLVGWLIPLLDAYNAFLTAGAGVVMLFGGGWLFWRIEIAIQQPVRISVLADELGVLNTRTGIKKNWRFDEIAAYRFSPVFRGASWLRLKLRSGEKVRLVARDAGFTNGSTDQFIVMVKEFETAWHLYKAR